MPDLVRSAPAPPAGGGTGGLDALIAAWLAAKQGRSGSAATARTYAADLASFRAALRSANLDLDADPRAIALALQAWADRGAPAPATYNRRRAVISSFYAYAVRHGLLSANPAERVERRVVDPYRTAPPAAATIRARLAAIDRTTPAGLRDYALLALTLATGRRLAEVAALRQGDLADDGVRLTVTFARCKGGVTLRDALPAAVAQALRAWLAVRPGADDPPNPPAGGGTGGFDARPDLLAILQEQPHRLVIGRTRGGKTTLLHKLATDWAASGARVVVCDPDAAPGLWPGCEAVGHGDDLAAIERMLHAVRAEVQTRRAQRAQGVRRFAPLHLVIDEAHDVVPGVPGALDLVEDIARRGAKLGVHLTIGVQDRQVKTLGLEGKSAVLHNFQTVEMLRDADGRRIALLHDPVTGERRRMEAPDLPDPERLIVPPPDPRAPPSAADAALLAQLLATPPPAGGGEQATVHLAQPGPVTVNVTAVAGALPGRRTRPLAQPLRDAYRNAGKAGESFRAAYRRLGGNRNEAFEAWRQGRGA